MKVRVKASGKGRGYRVEIQQGNQYFHLDYAASKLEAEWMASMFRIALERHDRERDRQCPKKTLSRSADAIRAHNKTGDQFTPSQLATLAVFCRQQNSQFMRDRWLDYIAGLCGPNGGTL